jgi:hypothetical protein
MKTVFVHGPCKGSIEEKLGIASAWLQQCAAKHHNCRRLLTGIDLHDDTESVDLPTRLVQIEDETTARIVPTEGQSGRYVALSYVWGSKPVAKLTKQNFPNFQEEISTPELPRTLADAIKVTKRLGVSHIWIDSLCIVQDDPEDWEREASRMADIYQNALVTMVPLGDRDSLEDIVESPSEIRIPSVLALPENTSEDLLEELPDGLEADVSEQRGDAVEVLGTPFVSAQRREVVQIGLDQEMQHSRWMKRAWTFQERALSRRILFFGRHQLYWECQTAAYSEDGFDDLVAVEPSKASLHRKRLQTPGLTSLTRWAMFGEQREFPLIGDETEGRVVKALADFAVK